MDLELRKAVSELMRSAKAEGTAAMKTLSKTASKAKKTILSEARHLELSVPLDIEEWVHTRFRSLVLPS